MTIQTQSSERKGRQQFLNKHAGRTEQVRSFSKQNLGRLQEAGIIYFPGPALAEHAFHRRLYGDGRWSLSGITHTTSSSIAMDAIADLLAAPIRPWDSLICTSTAVKKNVEAILQAQADYLSERLGISKLVLPLMPVIPLGIHTEDFAFTSQQKRKARK